MEGQCLPLQLLLLVFTVIMGLDVYSGTVVSPNNAPLSLEGRRNDTAPDHNGSLNGNTTNIEDIYNYLAYYCWMKFLHLMNNVSKIHWCEWRAIGRPYTNLRDCLENYADRLNYSFPNALAENYIVIGHRLFFLNCTLEHSPLLDPPENILLLLIITPICLIPFLVTLVVVKSKDGETQA